MDKTEQRPVLIPVEVVRFFERFVRFVTATFRSFVQTVNKHEPLLQRIVNQQIDQRKRITRLSYRKKKSQAKNWRKWRKRRRGL
ncbi:hypothetical protein PMI08_05247 [Brevibacillus sp. CF112]|uniref:hypothetical protein n=1 Tax=Brevibacillus TaxID=55080 RepID=UPI000271A2B5|nr:hypothetical protein [Brevibacillus sp. CF112]EJL38963.1 hypothetical protein PMI08_05247 [Brevibacillus sp. CF112]